MQIIFATLTVGSRFRFPNDFFGWGEAGKPAKAGPVFLKTSQTACRNIATGAVCVLSALEVMVIPVA